MIDRVLVRNKLKKMEQYIKELQSLGEIDYEEVQKNVILKRFIERNLELAIQQMIDVCKHIVAKLDLRTPTSYADCFEVLAEESLISSDNLQKYKNMARFRNLLIHMYENVSDRVVFDIFKENLEDFYKFSEEIKEVFRL